MKRPWQAFSRSYGTEVFDKGYSRTVLYHTRDHLSIITQQWGSVNRKVLPFCAINVAIALALLCLSEFADIDLTMTEFGHQFMAVLVAFLVIQKLSFMVRVYYELQERLVNMNRACVEIAQLACACTARHSDEQYREWRFRMSYHAVLLLRTMVRVVLKGGGEKVWEIPELEREEKLIMFVQSGDQTRSKGRKTDLYDWGFQSRSDLNLRVPIRMAHRIRNELMKHYDLPEPLGPSQEQQLILCIRDFMRGYHGVRKYLTAPFPFPLVQMSRIFVIVYVFTLPFAVLSPGLGLKFIHMVLILVLMTYGFMGIELLFIELSDPFAEDENDLPLVEEAQAACEDIVLALADTDGENAIARMQSKLGLPVQTVANVARSLQEAAETDNLPSTVLARNYTSNNTTTTRLHVLIPGDRVSNRTANSRLQVVIPGVEVRYLAQTFRESPVSVRRRSLLVSHVGFESSTQFLTFIHEGCHLLGHTRLADKCATDPFLLSSLPSWQ